MLGKIESLRKALHNLHIVIDIEFQQIIAVRPSHLRMSAVGRKQTLIISKSIALSQNFNYILPTNS